MALNQLAISKRALGPREKALPDAGRKRDLGMRPDFILFSGDKVNFLPGFGVATVVVKPGELKGSGSISFKGRKVCVAGDEKNVRVPGCPYMTPQYSIPGTGTLLIGSLAYDHEAKETMSDGKPVLLRGGQFSAIFRVDVPAQQPPSGPGSPIPDSTPQYQGNGTFIITIAELQGI